MAAVSRGTSHVTTKQRCEQATSVDIQKRAIKSSHSFRMTCDKNAVSLIENGEYRCIKATSSKI